MTAGRVARRQGSDRPGLIGRTTDSRAAVGGGWRRIAGLVGTRAKAMAG